MSAFHRWGAVALGVLLIVGLPVAWRVRPAPDVEISAAALLELVRSADDQPYSGYVETQGTLQLPVASRFTDIGTLFGEQNRLRVWWQDSDSWRVDRTLTTGEVDLIHEGDQTTEYDFDDSEASTSVDPDIRLPRTADLLPPELARRLLDDVQADEATRLDTRRIAGVTAPGLRLSPASDQSSIDHVDLWADPETGLALRVEVYGTGSSDPGMTSRFLAIDIDRPSNERVGFVPTATTDVDFEDVLDIADAANQYAPLRPPDAIAGLERRDADGDDGAVGVYGRGLTQLIAIPLRGREAAPLRNQLGITPGSTLVDDGVLVSVGPLGVLLTGTGRDGGFLLAGTVTSDALVTAARDLIDGIVFLEDDDVDDDLGNNRGGRG